MRGRELHGDEVIKAYGGVSIRDRLIVQLFRICNSLKKVNEMHSPIESG